MTDRGRPRPIVKDWCAQLRAYDFSGAIASLVACVPGTHTGEAMKQYGKPRGPGGQALRKHHHQPVSVSFGSRGVCL
jgi:hypothetical protein